MSQPLDPSAIDGRIGFVMAELGLCVAEAQWLAQRVPSVYQSERREIADQERASLQALDQKARTSTAARLRDRGIVLEAGVAEATRMAALLAPGALSAAWDSPDWQRPQDFISEGFPRYVRVGTTSGIPVLHPLGDSPGWAVRGTAAEFAELTRGLVVRMLANLGPHRLTVLTHDPALTSDVGALGALRSAHPGCLPPAITSPDDTAATLRTVLRHIAEVEDRLAQSGTDTVWDAADSHPMWLIVFHDGVGGLADEATALLQQVVATGARRGVLVMARGDGLPGMATVVLGSSGSGDAVPGVRWVPDPPPDHAFLATIADGMADLKTHGTEPLVPFAPLIAGLDDRWLDPGLSGLTAVIGRTSGPRPQPLRIDLRSEDPPMPNALIGGAVGQGKSNLLLVLIHALAAQYSPEDLEMVLLDFRDGVEFAALGAHNGRGPWLPHAIVLGLEADREFGVAVLEEMAAELARRTDAFKRAGVAKINAYRERTGEAMPRRVLIIDEFQRLFEGDGPLTERAVALLDDLSRTGRAAGFHIILASQTISGIRALATRGDAIFGQFHHRISLRNTPAESAAILSPHNAAAASITARGEVIVNSSLGDPDANQRGVVAYASEQDLAALRAELWVASANRKPPYVFIRSSPAVRTDEVRTVVADAAASAPGSLCLTPGAPVSVRERARTITLGRGGEQSVAVLGTDRNSVARLFGSFLEDAHAQAVHTVLLDGFGSEAALAGLDVGERVGARDVAQTLGRLTGQGHSPTLVLMVGLDLLDLERPDPDTFRAPLDDLRNLVSQGCATGVWSVGWWQSRHAAERALGFQTEGVRAWAFCGAPEDDIKAVCGPLVAAPSGSPRLLWHDRQRPSPETLVPFDIPGSS